MSYPTFHLIRGAIDANTEPLTLAVAKLHVKEDGDDQNTAIQALCTAAREQCEAETGRSLVNGPLTLTLDGFPCDAIRIPVGVANVANVTIAYVDANGATQTLANTEYRVLQRQNDYPEIVPVYGTSFPATRCEPDAVTVTFDCGDQTVAESLKAGMLLVLGYLFENREPKPVERNAIHWLWNPHRLVGF
jgi:uncharacterized phiE125 gp8 family phage protein